jgi:radical SAM-linked protein
VPDETGSAAGSPPPAAPPEPRQRWRLVVARTADAPDRSQRETAAAWEAAIVAAGLPVASTAGTTSRPRVAFGAPLPAGMAADAELIDIVLVERRTAWQVREALGPLVPPGWRLIELHDVWLAGPALAGQVAAADYRIELGPAGGEGGVHPDRIQAACQMLLAARRVPRVRRKGEGTVAYDLRPLVAHVEVADAGPPLRVRARTRFHPELGTGRPEEVVAALGELIGTELEAVSTVREGLVLVDDLEAPAQARR